MQGARGPSRGAVAEFSVLQEAGGGLTPMRSPLARAIHWKTEEGSDSTHNSSGEQISCAE